MHKLRIGLGLIASLWAISAMPTYAAAPPALRESVAVCDPNSPTHCVAPTSGGAMPISGSITADNASVGANAATAPTSSTQIGTLVGTALQPVSVANPLPISGSISVTNASVGATGAAVPASATYLGGNNGGNTIGLTLNGSGQPTIANTAFTANAGTNLNTSALALSASQTNGNQKTQIVDGSGNVIASTSNNLNVQCANCSGSGASAADAATFTAGSSVFAPSGGFYQTTPTSNALTNGQQGFVQMTINRAFHTNLRNASGVEIGTSLTPLQVTLANTGANATAIKVDGSAATQPVSGTVAATQSGAWNITNISGTVSLPTGAATAAKQPAFGSSGSSSSDVLSVQGIGGGTPFEVFASDLPLPTGASTAAHQTDGTQSTQIVDGSGNVIASTSNRLNVQCGNCSGSGVSTADEATFTAGTSVFAGVGGFYQTTATSNALTNGQQGFVQMTASRSLFSNLRNASGTEVGTSTTPLQVTLANTGSNASALLVTGTAGTFPVTGTVTANAGTNLNTSALALETGGNLATIAASITSSVQQHNVKQVNGVTTLAGAGAVGTGAQRVAVGQDTTTIAGSAPGTAGSASANVVTVQGVASMTPLFVGNTQASATSGQSGPLVQGAVTTANPSYTTAQTSPLSLDTNGNLRVSQYGNLGTVLQTQTDTVMVGGVNIKEINAVTPLMGNGTTGTGSLRVTLASDTSTNTNPLYVQGGAANNATTAGNPMQQSCLAVSAEPTLATNGQNASCIEDLAHKQIVMPYANKENFVSGTTSAMTGTTSTSLVAAPGSGLYNYITQISCVNSHATVGTFVTVQDGSGGTALMTLAAASVFGGSSYTFPTPLKQPTSNTALYVADVTTGANVICSATGYKGS